MCVKSIAESIFLSCAPAVPCILAGHFALTSFFFFVFSISSQPLYLSEKAKLLLDFFRQAECRFTIEVLQ